MDELLTALSDLHTRVYKAATIALADFSADPTTAPVAIALAFALGMVHALMPGHGKTVVFSYFLGQGARVGAGVAMALKIAALHVGAAIFLLLVIGASVVRLGRLQGAGRAMEIASYAAVALIGVWLFYRTIGTSRLQPAHDHHAPRAGILAYAIGFLPCPLTLILMNYALVNGTVLGGLFLTGVMACGIAVTMTATGMLAILVRRAVTAGFSPASLWYGRVLRGLEIGGAALIFGLGFVLLVRTL